MVLDTSEIKAPVIGEEKRQRVVGKFRGIYGETVCDRLELSDAGPRRGGDP